MNISKIANNIGIKADTLHKIKSSNPDKWAYISALDDDFIKAWHKYQFIIKCMIADLEKIFYELEDRGQLLRFSEHLCEKGIYRKPKTFPKSVKRELFKEYGMPTRHKTLLKYLKVIDEYENFKELKDELHQNTN